MSDRQIFGLILLSGFLHRREVTTFPAAASGWTW